MHGAFGRTRLAAVLAVSLVAACSFTDESPGGEPAFGGAPRPRAPPIVPTTGEPCKPPPGSPSRYRDAVPRLGLSCRRYPFELGAPRDVIEARDGSLLVTEMAKGRIVRLTPEGFAKVADGLVAPIGLREAADGSLVVAEEFARRVSRVDRATGARTTIAEGLGNVTYLALGPDGAAYVSSFTSLADATGVVMRVPLDVAGAPAVAAAGLVVPEGVAFRASELVVAEWGTQPSRLVAAGASAPGATIATGFVGLYGVVRAPRDDGFIVADVRGDRVAHVHADGRVEDLVRDLAAPAGMWIAANGDVLVVEHGDADTHAATGYLARVSGL